MSETTQPTCEERIDAHWKSTREELARNWAVYTGEAEPDDETTEESVDEYGLCFDYVAPGTFDDQAEGFWRYQLSTGGPGDEVRFFASSPGDRCYKIEYWFLDWYDGAHRNVLDDDLMTTYWEWFQEGGSVQHVYDEARA